MQAPLRPARQGSLCEPCEVPAQAGTQLAPAIEDHLGQRDQGCGGTPVVSCV
jgi:hypothetical protein